MDQPLFIHSVSGKKKHVVVPLSSPCEDSLIVICLHVRVCARRSPPTNDLKTNGFTLCLMPAEDPLASALCFHTVNTRCKVMRGSD